MPIRLCVATATILAAAVLCSGDAEAARHGCNREAAAALVGHAVPSDARARALTGARAIRRIAPGQPVTKDYRFDRLTLEIERGRVVAASCG